MNLEQHIEEIRAGIKAGRYSNEAAVSQGIVLRVLHALAWPAYDYTGPQNSDHAIS
jgi:hypothetical protein